MYSTYLRLDITVCASDRAVIRAAQKARAIGAA
jgi:hypothetical protein